MENGGCAPAFRAPAFACAPAPFPGAEIGGEGARIVLSASGDRGERVRAWDAETGDTVGEWGADGTACFGAAAGGFGAGVAHAPVTALCWGGGAESERFGKTSFAVGTAEGVVRVYGPA